MNISITTHQDESGGWCWSYFGVKDDQPIEANCGDVHSETQEAAVAAAKAHAVAASVVQTETVLAVFDDEGVEVVS